MTLKDVTYSESQLFPSLLGGRRIDHGGVYVFRPGEVAHPEPRHVHDTEEVFILVQGQGVIPIDGVEYPVHAGDVVIVEPGEDHHTRSSDHDPLVSVWYVMAKAE